MNVISYRAYRSLCLIVAVTMIQAFLFSGSLYRLIQVHIRYPVSNVIIGVNSGGSPETCPNNLERGKELTHNNLEENVMKILKLLQKQR